MHAKRNWIAVAAVVGIAWSVASGIVLTHRRARILVDTGVTRASIEHSLNTLLPKAAESARASALLKAAAEVGQAPYVAALWVVTTAGEIVFHQGGPGQRGDKIQELARDDMAPTVEALPAGALSDTQRLQLLAVAAMRREGDHNDVFRHIVRVVANPAGGLAAVVVLAYDVNPAVGGAPDAVYLVLLLGAVAGFGVYWLGLPLWVAADARARGDAVALWGLFVLFTNLVGLMAYLLVIWRPARRAAQSPGL
jgi:hypothetical protein